MIRINIAGTGSILCKGIIYLQRYEDSEISMYIRSIETNTDEGIAKTIINLLETIDLNEDEIVSLGSLHYTIGNRVRLHFKGHHANFNLDKSGPRDQEEANNIFMERLYNMGVRKSVTLYYRNFKEFNTDLIYEIAKSPYLRDYIKPTFKTDELLEKINAVELLVTDLLADDLLDGSAPGLTDSNIL